MLQNDIQRKGNPKEFIRYHSSAGKLQPARRFIHTRAVLRDFLTAHQKPQGEEDIHKEQPRTALLQIPMFPREGAASPLVNVN